MLKQRLLAAVIGIESFLTLVFGVGPGHSLAAAATMPNMAKQMPQNQCQSSCSAQHNVATINGKTVVEDKDLEPQPAEPYYLMFMGVDWSTAILLSGYLLWHLLWRPPDLVKLYANYRL